MKSVPPKPVNGVNRKRSRDSDSSSDGPSHGGHSSAGGYRSYTTASWFDRSLNTAKQLYPELECIAEGIGDLKAFQSLMITELKKKTENPSSKINQDFGELEQRYYAKYGTTKDHRYFVEHQTYRRQLLLLNHRNIDLAESIFRQQNKLNLVEALQRVVSKVSKQIQQFEDVERVHNIQSNSSVRADKLSFLGSFLFLNNVNLIDYVSCPSNISITTHIKVRERQPVPDYLRAFVSKERLPIIQVEDYKLWMTNKNQAGVTEYGVGASGRGRPGYIETSDGEFREVFVKKISMDSITALFSVVNEISWNETLRGHDHVLPFLFSAQYDDGQLKLSGEARNLILVSEKAETDLYKHIKGLKHKKNDNISEFFRKVIDYSVQTIKAMQALFQAGLFYDDLKWANLLLSKEKVYVTDFAICRPALPPQGYMLRLDGIELHQIGGTFPCPEDVDVRMGRKMPVQIDHDKHTVCTIGFLLAWALSEKNHHEVAVLQKKAASHMLQEATKELLNGFDDEIRGDIECRQKLKEIVLISIKTDAAERPSCDEVIQQLNSICDTYLTVS